MSNKTTANALYRHIFALVEEIPRGQVASYGQLADKLGTSARTVGFALASLSNGSATPWQRVVNRNGEISPRKNGDGELLQRILLEKEGVCFDTNGKISLARYGWKQAL